MTHGKVNLDTLAQLWKLGLACLKRGHPLIYGNALAHTGGTVATEFFRSFTQACNLAFLLCLIAPFRNLRSLLAVVIVMAGMQALTMTANGAHWFAEAPWLQPLADVALAGAVLLLAITFARVTVSRSKLERKFSTWNVKSAAMATHRTAPQISSVITSIFL